MKTVDFDPTINVGNSPSTMKAGGFTQAGMLFHLLTHSNLRLFCGSLSKEHIYILTYTNNQNMTSKKARTCSHLTQLDGT
jgi:hypothetical protein